MEKLQLIFDRLFLFLLNPDLPQHPLLSVNQFYEIFTNRVYMRTKTKSAQSSDASGEEEKNL